MWILIMIIVGLAAGGADVAMSLQLAGGETMGTGQRSSRTYTFPIGALEPGTTVCIKAGTQITLVEVDADGWITQDHILNPVQNNFLAISYYAYAGTGSSA